MELDPRTLFVASMLCAAVLGGLTAAFGAVLPGTHRMVSVWGKGMLLLALGLWGLVLRGAIPDWASIGVANTLVVAGMVRASEGLRALGDEPRRDVVGWVVTAAIFPVLMFFTEVVPSTWIRVVVVNGALGFIAARDALLLRRSAPPGARRSARFAEIVLWSLAVGALLRVGGAVILRPQVLMANDPVSTITMLSYTAFIVLMTLSIILLELELAQSGLVHAARHDALTGVLNRGTFLVEFEARLASSASSGGGFSLAIFDLDDFKQINDALGHPTGDSVLQGFARVLRDCARKQDVIARYGGEEFALLMPEADKQAALALSESIRRRLESGGIDLVDGARVQVTVSGGVACYGADGADWQTLLRAADDALYQAKREGRNSVRAAPDVGSRG